MRGEQVVLVILALAVSGCATKRYGRLQPVTGMESAQYSCQHVELELDKVRGFEEQVRNGAKFDALSIASFLGDFGVGNVIERNTAEKSALERRQQLEALKAARCSQPTEVVATQPASSLPLSATAPVDRAQLVSSGMGCGLVTPASDSAGRSLFVASCASGARVLIDCSALGCRPAATQ